MNGADDAAFVDELLGRCTFPPTGSRVDLAVSGGADSISLLLLAVRRGLDVVVHHVDHGLRPSSHSDADVVRAAAGRFDIEVVVHRVDVVDGPNLEARARAARYDAMPTDVLTGHTADDRAETVLINLLRGAGTRGLSPMSPSTTRPLLSLRRRETVELCRRSGVDVVDDETNTDARFVRNRIRHELLPLIESISRRDPVPLLVRSANVLGDDEQLLDELSLGIDPTDARALAEAPPALARRAIRRWLADPYAPDVATVERVLEVARGTRLACDVGKNREIRRNKQRLRLDKVR